MGKKFPLTYMKYRRNPNLATQAAMQMLAPYITLGIAGLTIYYFRKQIFEAVGAGLTGKSITEYKADVATVTTAMTQPIATTADIVKYVALSGEYITQEQQKAAIEAIKKAKGWA